jgi:hypothetical protein
MLEVKKELSRASGGVIPPGSILMYQITTFPQKSEVSIVFSLYLNADAIKSGKKPIPIQDVDNFKKPDGTPVQGGFYTPDNAILKGLTPNTLVNITDTIAKAYAEEAFLGENSCEKIGDKLPD